eukprot:147081-Amphidinium_carterae.1
MLQHFASISHHLAQDRDLAGPSVSVPCNLGSGKEKEPGRPRDWKAAKRRKQLPPLRFATINTRSLLCDDTPGLAATARSKVFRQEMREKDFDLIMAQETKLDKKYVFDCEEYMAVAASPVRGVGGLQTLIAKNKALRILWTREFSWRVLAVGFAWGREKWCAINIYLPTSAAPQNEYDEYWAYAMQALELAKRNGLAVIVGGDFNTRLGGLRDDVHIGAAVSGGQLPEHKERASRVADGLQCHQLAAWSTIIGEPHTTWVSPHDSEAQIDYLMGDISKLKRITNIGITPLALIPSDHKIVWGELMSIGSDQKPAHRLRPKPCRVLGPDHDLAIRLALTAADHEGWKQKENPVDAINACLKLVREIAKKAPAPTTAIKQDWIGPLAWSEIRKGAVLRRRLETVAKKRKKTAMRWAWSTWRDQRMARDERTEHGMEAIPVQWYSHEAEAYLRNQLLWMLWRVVCKRQTKKVQRLVKEDKTAWLSSMTEELARVEQEGVSSEKHKQVKRCLTKIRPNQLAVKRGPIRDASGSLKTTQDEKEVLWQEHWSKLYAGQML